MITHSVGLIPRTKEASDARAKADKQKPTPLPPPKIPRAAKVINWLTLEEDTLVGIRWREDDGTVSEAYFRFSSWTINGLSPWVNPEEIERLNNEEEARRQKREALLGK